MKPQDLCSVLEKYIKLARAAACTSGEARSLDDRAQRYKENLVRDFFLLWSARGQPWPITAAMVLDWVSQGCTPTHPYRDRHRFFAIRDFLKYLRAVESRTEVPVNVFRKPPRRIPRLFSQQEITKLIEAPSRLRLVHPYRSLMLSTLIGLLSSTGLRIGEALSLLDIDVRLEADPAHLVINNSKFGKSRIVVLHASAVPHLLDYRVQRALLPSISSARAFFTNPAGRPLGYIATYRTFRRLLRHAQITSKPPDRAATLHSFRHTFAVERLTCWHREGKNVRELLPHLSVYLGHTDPVDTYWYLTATPELLDLASSLFEAHYSKGVAK